MNMFRKAIVVASAWLLSLAAGNALAQNVKYFTLTEVSITGNTVSAKFANVDNGNSTFNAISLKAIGAGATATFSSVGVTAGGVAVGAGSVFLQDSNTKLIVTDLAPVKKGKFIVITAKINVSVGDGQCAPSIAWAGGAWTGSVSSPSQPFQQQNANSSTSVGAACTLSIDKPTSIARNDAGTASEEFAALVTLKDSNSNAVTGVSFSLSGSGACSFATNPTGTTGTLLEHLVATLTTSSTCTLAGTVTYQGVNISASKSIPVYNGVLPCDTSGFDALKLFTDGPASDGFFNESTGGATKVGDAGLLFGVRGLGNAKPEGTDLCPALLNYTVTNNINGSGETPDIGGNYVPKGFYSFVFDASSVPAPVVAILSSYKPEWSDPDTGLPTRKTLICSPSTGSCPTGGPTFDTNGDPIAPWYVMPSCKNTIVERDSIPGTIGGCVAKEEWWPVMSGCPTTTDTGTNLRCLQISTIVILGKDPVFGRGN